MDKFPRDKYGASAGKLQPYAWPGGYLIVYYSPEGDPFHAQCFQAELDDEIWGDEYRRDGFYQVDEGCELRPWDLCTGCNEPLDPHAEEDDDDDEEY